jgi:hypothetical protein
MPCFSHSRNSMTFLECGGEDEVFRTARLFPAFPNLKFGIVPPGSRSRHSGLIIYIHKPLEQCDRHRIRRREATRAVVILDCYLSPIDWGHKTSSDLGWPSACQVDLLAWLVPLSIESLVKEQVSMALSACRRLEAATTKSWQAAICKRKAGVSRCEQV